MVWLRITHSVLPIASEKNFNETQTIENIKDRIQVIVGTSPEHMVLELKSDTDAKIATLTDDNATLADYNVQDRYTIHVIDNDPSQSMAELSDVSQVEKYEISEKDYDKRENTFRRWKERNLKEHYQKKKEQFLQREEQQKEYAKDISVGDRCEVEIEPGFKPRGKVMFVGETEFAPGTWVGIRFDEPVGKNDGSVQGKRYFTCESGLGRFVKPHKVTPGDFPEEDIFGSDDDEI